MYIELSNTGSPRNALVKEISSTYEMIGTLRESCSIMNPSFTIVYVGVPHFNYCYIGGFNKYYFIDNITSLRNNLWLIECSADVLHTYAQKILDCECIISDEYSPDTETYMNGNQWQTTVKTKTNVINFPNGLLDNGEYILITSGGIA